MKSVFLARVSQVVLWGLLILSGLLTVAGVLFAWTLYGNIDGPDFTGLAVIYVLIVVVPVTLFVGLLFLFCLVTIVLHGTRRDRANQTKRVPERNPSRRDPTPSADGAEPTRRQIEKRGRSNTPTRPALARQWPRSMPTRTRAPRTPQVARRTVLGASGDPFRLFDMMREHPVPWLFALGGFLGASVIWHRVLGVEPSGSNHVEVLFIGFPGALLGYAVYSVTLGRRT